MQPVDNLIFEANDSVFEQDFGLTPKITLREGLRRFVEWYKEYSQ